MVRFAAALATLCLSLAWQISDSLAQMVSTPRELAIIRINVLDLLVHEPSLPLPVRQRRDALWQYYQALGGELLWLGSRRPEEFLARLHNAASDGLDPKDYPSKQLATLAAAKATDDKRSLALVDSIFRRPSWNMPRTSKSVVFYRGRLIPISLSRSAASTRQKH